jgi:hypothetical protein
VGTARRSRGIARHGRSCSWSRGQIPPNEPEEDKIYLKSLVLVRI